MKNFLRALLFVLFAAFAQNAVAQNISNEGTEFWTVFPTHDPSGGSLATMNVNITSKFNSEVTVSCGSWTSPPTFIPANQVTTFLVPRPQSYIAYGEQGIALPNRGIHIVVTPGKPKVVAYSHVFAGFRSAATLILPYDALGQQYFSMNYTQDDSGPSSNFLVLVAVEDNTDLVLKKNDGGSIKISLPQKGDVYEYMPQDGEDLTGTYVEVDANSACKRFAAFSGSTSLIIGCYTSTNSSRDPLLQQLYAVNSWGKTYGVIPFINRQYVVRILAQEDETTIKLNGLVITKLNKGKYFEQTFIEPVTISADKLISVAEYSFSQNCAVVNNDRSSIGDPEMVLLNPIEFNIKNITVFSSNKNTILDKYINVFMKTDKASTFKLNGNAPSGIWKTMPADPTYSYLQLQVSEESLTLSADDGFNAIAYGFGNAESYAYSAGTNLATSSFLVLTNETSHTDNSVACVNQVTNLKLTVPYRLTKITWKFDDGSSFEDIIRRAPVITLDPNGGTLYTYTSNVNRKFTTVGATVINAVAVVESTSAPSCFSGADLEFSFTVDVLALPVPDFTVSSTDVCLGAVVTPQDISSDPTNLITKWRWQFDNESPVEEKSPSHLFKTIGNHTIKLWIANEGGCWSTTPKVIIINIAPNKVLPQLAFTALPVLCEGGARMKLVAGTTNGVAGNGIFTGVGVESGGYFNPASSGGGSFEVTYTYTSTTGCVNEIKQMVEVVPLPIIKAIKDVFILSGGKKVIPALVENPNPVYKFKWRPAIGLSRDDILNPIASPTVDTKYTLTITVNSLCTIVMDVTVKVMNALVPPNVFSPNGDGVNDVWGIKELGSFPNPEVQVFDRNGQRVFRSIGYAIPFDGNYQNKPLPVGVYYYIIDPKNGKKAITGSLTLIR